MESKIFLSTLNFELNPIFMTFFSNQELGIQLDISNGTTPKVNFMMKTSTKIGLQTFLDCFQTVGIQLKWNSSEEIMCSQYFCTAFDDPTEYLAERYKCTRLS